MIPNKLCKYACIATFIYWFLSKYLLATGTLSYNIYITKAVSYISLFLVRLEHIYSMHTLSYILHILVTKYIS